MSLWVRLRQPSLTACEEPFTAQRKTHTHTQFSQNEQRGKSNGCNGVFGWVWNSCRSASVGWSANHGATYPSNASPHLVRLSDSLSLSLSPFLSGHLAPQEWRRIDRVDDRRNRKCTSCVCVCVCGKEIGSTQTDRGKREKLDSRQREMCVCKIHVSETKKKKVRGQRKNWNEEGRTKVTHTHTHTHTQRSDKRTKENQEFIILKSWSLPRFTKSCLGYLQCVGAPHTHRKQQMQIVLQRKNRPKPEV